MSLVHNETFSFCASLFTIELTIERSNIHRRSMASAAKDFESTKDQKDHKAVVSTTNINLIAALKVFQDHELQSTTKKLLQFKNKIAWSEWIGNFNLQRLLQDANYRIVRCGCNICLHGCMGSPANYDFTGQDDDEVDLWIRREEKEKGPFRVSAISGCLLYDWFRDRCLEKEGTPVPFRYPCKEPILLSPSATMVHPVHTIASQLGMYPAPLDDFKTLINIKEKFWIAEVGLMPYPQQVKTVYAVVHEITNLIQLRNNHKPTTFKKWFSWKGLSLLP